MTTERFKHYSICINSRDSFKKMAASFDRSPPGWAGAFRPSAHFDSGGATVPWTEAPDGWHQYLRPGALRAFLEITDDSSDTNYTNFRDWMYSKAPSYFGTSDSRNWVFHSILGLTANTPAADPWLPTDPVVTGRCSGGAGDGQDYQELSILSEGLRFPICNNGNFDVMFQAVAERVVEGSTIPCRYSPAPVGGTPVDLERVIVAYTPGGGSATNLVRVASVDACDTGDYYVDTDAIQLCPDMCTTAESDPAAEITVLVGCEASCGNDRREGDEQCDDGNTESGDGCSDVCEIESICGDGLVTGTEQCDDGNRDNLDGCDENCLTEII